MRKDPPEVPGSPWIDRALRDVERLRREIEGGGSPRPDGSSAGPVPPSWMAGVRESLLALEAAARASEPPSAPAWTPPVEILELGDEVEAVFELPGVDASSIRVRFDGVTLAVEGRRTPPPCGTERLRFSERSYGPFRREVALPAPVNAGQARATYRDGCLSIRLPRQPQRPFSHPMQ